MQKDTIHKIIAEKNDKLEYEATRTAEHIINQIAQKQHEIALANDKIVELRKELGDLEVEKVNVQQILGEE